MKRALALRHVAFEDLGTLRGALEALEYEVTYLDAGVDDLSRVDPAEPDLLVVLGGPISANDGDEHPFLAHELELLRARLLSDRPTLGVCLGAQLMAKALGAAVRKGEQKEIGWAPLEFTPEGLGHPLGHLAAEGARVLHWHGETFDLPAGATLLASTAAYRNQAFSFGRRALGLQFHPEVTAAGLERWYIGHACELALSNLRPAELRRDANRHAAGLAQRAARLWGAWLRSI